jgi:hypothetical protein
LTGQAKLKLTFVAFHFIPDEVMNPFTRLTVGLQELSVVVVGK